MQERQLNCNGNSIHYYECAVPAGVTLRGVLLFNPAMGTKARFYRPLAEAFSARGYHTFVHELRGNGISPVRASRGCDFGYRDLLQDLTCLVDEVKSRFPAVPLLLSGHSLGGQLSVLYAAKHAERVDQILLVACGTPHYQGFSGRMKRMLRWVPYLFTSTARLAGYFPGHRLGFGGRQGKTLIEDWSALARTNHFSVHGDDTDYGQALAGMPVPVLSVWLEHDNFAPKDSARALSDQCPAEHTRLVGLSEATLGFRADHMNWVKQADVVVPLLLDQLALDAR